MTTRKYTQQARAAAADETRRRILDAMRDRLRAAPSEPLSIERVAQDAGVARSTVYLVFGSKAGLFEALGQDLLARTGFQRIVDAVALPDARDAVAQALRAAARCTPPSGTSPARSTRCGRSTPTRCGGAFEVVERGRAEGQRRLAERLPRRATCAPGSRSTRRPTSCGSSASFETFDQLYTGRGPERGDVAARLIAMAERSLWEG